MHCLQMQVLGFCCLAGARSSTAKLCRQLWRGQVGEEGGDVQLPTTTSNCLRLCQIRLQVGRCCHVAGAETCSARDSAHGLSGGGLQTAGGTAATPEPCPRGAGGQGGLLFLFRPLRCAGSLGVNSAGCLAQRPHWVDVRRHGALIVPCRFTCVGDAGKACDAPENAGEC